MAKIEIPSQLIEQIQRGNCVLFLGAGISMSVDGIPSGKELSKELAERCGYKDQEMILSRVAQFYEMTLGRQSLIDYVCNRVDTPRNKPLSVHKLIAKMPFRTIVTTNYDTLLEQALRSEGKELSVVVNDKDVVFSDEAKVVLIKMHGDVQNRDSIVITDDDYFDFFAKHPAMADALSYYAATRTLLFLGYGLSDSTFITLSTKVSQNLGRLRKKAYAVQLRPSNYSKLYWEKKEIIKILDFPADAFLKKLRTALLLEEPVDQREAKAILTVVDEISGDLIHRLSNPLGLIRVGAMMLEEQITTPNPRQLEMIGLIKESTRNALDIIENLKSAYYDHALQPLDVNLSFNNMLAIITLPESIMLEGEIEENLPPVFMGSQQLTSVLRVLVENSIDALPDGGNILIKARLEKRYSKEWIKIEVRDTGAGISADQIGLIFQFGYSTKQQGRGFGLWWLRTVVERAGGEVNVVSEINKGTTFILKFPAGKLEKVIGVEE